MAGEAGNLCTKRAVVPELPSCIVTGEAGNVCTERAVVPEPPSCIVTGEAGNTCTTNSDDKIKNLKLPV